MDFNLVLRILQNLEEIVPSVSLAMGLVNDDSEYLINKRIDFAKRLGFDTETITDEDKLALLDKVIDIKNEIIKQAKSLVYETVYTRYLMRNGVMNDYIRNAIAQNSIFNSSLFLELISKIVKKECDGLQAHLHDKILEIFTEKLKVVEFDTIITQYDQRRTLQSIIQHFKENFQIKKAKADGNCFFYSFRQCLKQQKGIDVTTKQLREYCRDFILKIASKHNLERFEELLLGSLKDRFSLLNCTQHIKEKIKELSNQSEELKKLLVSEYCSQIIKGNAWGDAGFEGQILCEKYGVNLCLFIPKEKPKNGEFDITKCIIKSVLNSSFDGELMHNSYKINECTVDYQKSNSCQLMRVDSELFLLLRDDTFFMLYEKNYHFDYLIFSSPEARLRVINHDIGIHIDDDEMKRRVAVEDEALQEDSVARDQIIVNGVKSIVKKLDDLFRSVSVKEHSASLKQDYELKVQELKVQELKVQELPRQNWSQSLRIFLIENFKKIRFFFMKILRKVSLLISQMFNCNRSSKGFEQESSLSSENESLRQDSKEISSPGLQEKADIVSSGEKSSIQGEQSSAVTEFNIEFLSQNFEQRTHS